MGEEKRCETCAWWRNPNWTRRGWGDCGNDLTYRRVNYSRLNFDTHKNFGCIHWKERKEGKT